MVGQYKYTQGRASPTSTPLQGLPCSLSGWGGWSLAPHGDLSLVLLPGGRSGHHQGLFGVLKTNLGTTATWHGVWLKAAK